MAPSPAAPPFEAYGPAHLLVLALTVLLAGGLIQFARRYPTRTRNLDRIIAGFLLGLYPVQVVVSQRLGWLNADNAYPCHLCDAAALCGAAALWFRSQRFAELVWFWGLAGTLNGLITPALSENFPSLRFVFFFALHSGVVIAALYLVAGLNLRPRKGAVWRAFGWVQVYLAAAAVVNIATGSNYGFLRSKPPQASLLDVLGPWPWYIAALELLALLLFGLLYLPFWMQNRKEASFS